MTDLSTTTLPDEYDIMSRVLSVVDIHDFATAMAKNAGKELAAPGIVLMLYLAVADSVGGLQPMERVIAMHFERLIEVLVEDQQVRSEALGILKDARVPKDKPPARPELSDEDKASLMASIKKLATVYDEHVNYERGDSSQGHRDDGANPFYSQTLNGLFLEFYYGTPSKVWTPWGYWHFGAAQRYELDLDGFMDRLTLRVHSPEKQTNMGCIGPVYAILAIDSQELPNPVLPTDRRQYLSYEVSKEEWAQLFRSVS